MHIMLDKQRLLTEEERERKELEKSVDKYLVAQQKEKNLRHPKWLFIINTLPLLVLFALLFSTNDINEYYWKPLELVLGVLALLNLAYVVYLTLKKQNVAVWYALILFIVIPLICLYGWGPRYYTVVPMPSFIPKLMISRNLSGSIYISTFLMPTFAYALFILIAHFTPQPKEYNEKGNFVNAIIAFFIAGVLAVIPSFLLWKSDSTLSVTNVFEFLSFVVGLAYVFFVVRGFFILATKKVEVWHKHKLAFKMLITVVLPLMGLLVNGQTFRTFGDSSGLFGDFKTHWFYIIAIVNGFLLCLPNPENRNYRILLFIGRSITFSYTSYFFLMFISVFPLSIIAIMAFGMGFLMLTPLMLFAIHANELSEDFEYLKKLFSKKLVIGISVLCFLVIPALVIASRIYFTSFINYSKVTAKSIMNGN